MSWVALVYEVGAIRHAIYNEAVRGPVNVVAPNPVTTFRIGFPAQVLSGTYTIEIDPFFASATALPGGTLATRPALIDTNLVNVVTLEDPEGHYRIERFVENLRECKDAVAFFGLTLDSLLTRVVLPKKDRPIFLELMKQKLGLGSFQEPIADRL